MTGAEFRAERLRLGYSVRRGAAALGISTSTLQRYERLAEVPSYAAASLRALADTPTSERAERAFYDLGHLAALVEEAIGRRLQTHVVSPRVAVGYLLGLYEGADPQRRAAVDETVGHLVAAIPLDLPGASEYYYRSCYHLGYYQHRAAELPEGRGD